MATSSLCCLLGPGLLTSPAFCVIYTADVACGSVCVTVQCLSVCLSGLSVFYLLSVACHGGGFAAVGLAGRRCR